MKHLFKNDPAKIISILGDDQLEFESSMIQFSERVEIIQCIVINFDIYASLFIGGLRIENVIVKCPVKWMAGGHNKQPIILKDCVFEEFVDFEDCCFDHEIIFENVQFIKGTNFLGNKGTPVEVSFEFKPKMVDVTGELDINTFNK